MTPQRIKAASRCWRCGPQTCICSNGAAAVERDDADAAVKRFARERARRQSVKREHAREVSL